MKTDYDAPRDVEADQELLTQQRESIKRTISRGEDQRTAIDGDDELADVLELSDADLSGVQLTVRAIPQQSDEFTCSHCFLINHRSRLAEPQHLRRCRDCA